MKQLIKELSLSGLTLKQKAIVWYFVISFCLLASTAEAPFWFLFLEVANFANAARIIKRVPPRKTRKTVRYGRLKYKTYRPYGGGIIGTNRERTKPPDRSRRYQRPK